MISLFHGIPSSDPSLSEEIDFQITATVHTSNDGAGGHGWGLATTAKQISAKGLVPDERHPELMSLYCSVL